MLKKPDRWLKPVLHGLALCPLAWIAFFGVTGGLGANPIEQGLRDLGDWALIVLLVALAVTPLRRLTGWSALARVRRLVGLWAFAYAVLHILTYVGVDQFFDWAAIFSDLVKRTYIMFGMAAFVLLLGLALTSADRARKVLGGRRWKQLHKAVYAAGVLAVIHYVFMVKADLRGPIIYAVILAILLAARRLPLERLRTFLSLQKA